MNRWTTLVFLAFGACSRPSGPPPSASEASSAAPPATDAATPAPPSATTQVPLPPYDLQSDTRARLAAADAEFHRHVASSIERDVFLFLDADHGGRFDATLSLARKVLSAYFAGPFAKGPDRAVSVLVFSTTPSYLAACKARFRTACARDLGSYSGLSREIMVNVSQGVESVAHELVHPIVQTDAPALPIWLGEGLGSLFEAPRFSDDGSIHGGTNWRLPRLQAALSSAKEGDFVRVENVLALEDRAFFARDVDLHYALARFLCQWLDERGQLWPFYAKWRGSAAQDPEGVAAFREVVGESPEDATQAWRAWAKGLVLPPK